MHPQQLYLNQCPAVNLRDEKQLASMFPNDFIASLLRAADDATGKILASLESKDDPAPVAMFLGWDSVAPRIEIMTIDGRYYANGETKHALAMGLRDFVLKQRAMGTESFAVALINAAWLKCNIVSKSQLHTLGETGLGNEPDKAEVVLVDIIWQDGQRMMARAIERFEDKPPKFSDEWRDMSAGAAMVHNRFWHAIAPSLAAVAYAEAVLAAFEGEQNMEGGAK